jgi:hypothetical protein
MTAQSDAMAQMQQNAAARAIVLANSVLMIQPLPSQTVNPANQNTINFIPNNVGLTLGFLVEVTAGVTNGATNAAALTGFGASNLLSQITYTDLQNLQRVQTTGYHLGMLASAKQGFVFGGAYAPNNPIGYGNNWTVQSGPATLAATVAGTVRYIYSVPLAYNANDLRGAVYTGVVNATQNLQVVINTTPFVATGADPLNAVYIGNALGGYTNNVTVTVYQIYRDQIPFQNNMPILPLMDLNTVYDIKNTTITGLAANMDFPFAYPNMRQFLSTFAIYDNGGSFNTGSDVNYWSLTSANSTQLWKLSPEICALFARQTFMADPPAGVYYFDSRNKPIDTISFGNMALNLNASTVNASAKVIIGTEAFQQVNQIPYASSLQIGN